MCASPKQADATSWGMTKQASGPALPHTLQGIGIFRTLYRSPTNPLGRIPFHCTGVQFRLRWSATARLCTGAQARHPAIKKRMNAGSATQVF